MVYPELDLVYTREYPCLELTRVAVKSIHVMGHTTRYAVAMQVAVFPYTIDNIQLKQGFTNATFNGRSV